MKCYLRKIRLTSTGYAMPGYGAANYYYGIGDPVYICEPVDGTHKAVEFRASSRQSAKVMARQYFPTAIFYDDPPKREFILQTRTVYGWEDLTTHNTRKDALAEMRLYQESQPSEYRTVARRIG